jgi:hypothetical protein
VTQGGVKKKSRLTPCAIMRSSRLCRVSISLLPIFPLFSYTSISISFLITRHNSMLFSFLLNKVKPITRVRRKHVRTFIFKAGIGSVLCRPFGPFPLYIHIPAIRKRLHKLQHQVENPACRQVQPVACFRITIVADRLIFIERIRLDN